MSVNNNNNNDVSTANNNREPTIRDLFDLIGKMPMKSDFDDFKNNILATQQENKEKIGAVENKVVALEELSTANADKVIELEIAVQTLQQDKLKSNVCISGVPLNNNLSPEDAVVKIANALKVKVATSNFSAYSAANNKLIIAAFDNFSTKQQIINKLRIKKSLMAEEVFGSSHARSNSQIYVNDQLTKYFSELYLVARNAKRDGKLTSASSAGGRIRVRKNPNDAPIIITNMYQLNNLIELEASTPIDLTEKDDNSTGPVNQRDNTSTQAKSNKRKNRASSAASDNRNKKTKSN